MDRAMRFRINVPQVVHQTIDDEVVIIDLNTGSYYSLTGTAADIWTALGAGASLDEIVGATQARYEATTETIDVACAEFVAKLADERLVVPCVEAMPSASPGAVTAGAARREPFEPPVLQKYTDMQDLLLIDPIHEVDDLGWPGVKATGSDR